MTTNLRTGPEISSLYAFESAIYHIRRNISSRPETRHQAFRPGFMQAAAKISYRSEFVPFSSKYLSLLWGISSLLPVTPSDSCKAWATCGLPITSRYHVPVRSFTRWRRCPPTWSCVLSFYYTLLRNLLFRFPCLCGPRIGEFIRSYFSNKIAMFHGTSSVNSLWTLKTWHCFKT